MSTECDKYSSLDPKNRNRDENPVNMRLNMKNLKLSAECDKYSLSKYQYWNRSKILIKLDLFQKMRKI